MVPYRLVNGTQIAADWADLTDGAIDAPISFDESGSKATGFVWTDTTLAGTLDPTTCEDWTVTAAADMGIAGSTERSASGWTANFVGTCDETLHLYCFQQ
jgi:hypothetical protein